MRIGSAERDTHGGAATQRRGLSMRRLPPAFRRGMEQAGGLQGPVLTPYSRARGARGHRAEPAEFPLETPSCWHSRAPSVALRAMRSIARARQVRQAAFPHSALTDSDGRAAAEGKPPTDPGRSKPGPGAPRARHPKSPLATFDPKQTMRSHRWRSVQSGLPESAHGCPERTHSSQRHESHHPSPGHTPLHPPGKPRAHPARRAPRSPPQGPPLLATPKHSATSARQAPGPPD